MSKVFSRKTSYGRGISMDTPISGEMSAKSYNLTLTGVVFYGILVNAIMCSIIDPLEFFLNYNPITLFVAYIVLVIGGVVINNFCKSAIAKFIGYNMVVLPIGVVISVAVFAVGGIDSPVVMGACYYTALITAIMVIASYLFPNFFAKLGGVLLFSLITLLVVGILGRFIPALYAGGIYSYISACIFSLYIGFDVYRAQRFPKTVANAITAALDIYLDIANLFLDILRLLSDR